MMFKFKTFVGIDISKKTFDSTLLFPDSAVVNHQCFNQSKDGFTAFVTWLKSQQASCRTL
jgi:hypothetical protein